MKTTIDWLWEQYNENADPGGEVEWTFAQDLFKQAREMERKEALRQQIFIGAVAEIIGGHKTIQLLKESRNAL